MVCTKTLYNELWAGNLPLSLFEVPNALKRRCTKGKNHINKRPKGRSIEQRPAEVTNRVVLGHWEADTVVGLRKGKEAVVLTLVERITNHYIAIRISGKTSPAVQGAMLCLRAEFGAQFSKVFKTITTDNGPEFEAFAEVEQWGTKVFFAHPYSSWERPANEHHNGTLRAFLPKGASIEKYSGEQVLAFADEMNGLLRKRLGFRTPEALFDIF